MAIHVKRDNPFPLSAGGIGIQTVSQGNTQYLDSDLTIFGLFLSDIDNDLTYNFFNAGVPTHIRLKKNVIANNTVITSANYLTFFDVRNSGGGGGAVTSVNGQVGVVTLTKTDVVLSNVDNTSDLAKPVSTATQTALNGKVTSNTAIIAATKTKITYDTKGLVLSGTDATGTDILVTPITTTATSIATVSTNQQATNAEFATAIKGSSITVVTPTAYATPAAQITATTNNQITQDTNTNIVVVKDINGNTIQIVDRGIVTVVATISSAVTLTAQSTVVLYNLTGAAANYNVTLPVAATCKYRIYIKRTDYNPASLAGIIAQGTDKIENIPTANKFPLTTSTSTSETYILIPTSTGWSIA